MTARKLGLIENFENFVNVLHKNKKRNPVHLVLV